MPDDFQTKKIIHYHDIFKKISGLCDIDFNISDSISNSIIKSFAHDQLKSKQSENCHFLYLILSTKNIRLIVWAINSWFNQINKNDMSNYPSLLNHYASYYDISSDISSILNDLKAPNVFFNFTKKDYFPILGEVLSPIEIAARSANLSSLYFFLENGSQGLDIWPLFEYIVIKGRIDIAQILFKVLENSMSESDLITIISNRNILTKLCSRGLDDFNCVHIVKSLLNHGANPLLLDENGYSSVNYSVSLNCRNLIRVFTLWNIDKFNPNKRDKIYRAIRILISKFRKYLLTKYVKNKE